MEYQKLRISGLPMSVIDSIVLLSRVRSDTSGRLVPATALLVAIVGYGTSPGVVK